MAFSSIFFLLFFLPLVLLGYFLLPSRPQKNLFLLAVSCFFYIYAESQILGIILCLINSYLGGVLIERFRGTSAARKVAIVSVSINLAVLLYYKYSFFIASSLLSDQQILSRLSKIALPLGISFFTFHNISYLIDTYRGKIRAESRFTRLALYLFLFPHQIAGPIVRYASFQPLIDAGKSRLEDISFGIQRFVIGLAKKVLVANPCAAIADPIFAISTADLSTPLAWIGALAYTAQIYFDFSGYSDMAIGLARLFGYRFDENFRQPYKSVSLTEFWRRWHISLSSWFRDYVYIPLGGNRRGPLRTYLNLTIVFSLCGLWHGAGWTFLVWGFWHGIFLIWERHRSGAWIHTLPPWLGRTWTMAIVIGGWVFFRSERMEQALSFFGRMLMPVWQVGDSAFHLGKLSHTSGGAITLLLLGWITYLLWQKLQAPIRGLNALSYARIALLAVLLTTCIVRLADGTFNPFIYYRF